MKKTSTTWIGCALAALLCAALLIPACSQDQDSETLPTGSTAFSSSSELARATAPLAHGDSDSEDSDSEGDDSEDSESEDDDSEDSESEDDDSEDSESEDDFSDDDSTFITITVKFLTPVVLFAKTRDVLSFTVSDDLSGLELLNIFARGGLET